MPATIIVSEEGTEYVIRGGNLVEKCLHRTRTDKSSGNIRHEVCHDCGKTLIYNDTSRESFDPIKSFTEIHGRPPRGKELAAMW